MKTKLFTLLLTVAASVGTMFALSYRVQIGDLYYNLDVFNPTAEVTSLNSGYSGDIVIPSAVTYDSMTYSVTSIGDFAFENCSGLTSVTIPNSVTSIGWHAFSGCSSLPVVDNLRYADTYLVEAVDKTLSSYTIKDGTRWIGEYAFSGCRSLTSVTIPNSVTSIEDDAFYGCSSLPVVDNLRYADTYLVEAVDKTLSSYTIKDGTRWIGKFAFRDCSSLTSVTIPNSVTSIKEGAFAGCSSLTSVTIPNSVTSIGNGAFEGCSSLTSMVWNAKNYSDFAADNTPFVQYDKWSGELVFDLRSQFTSFTFGNEVEHIPANLCNGMVNLTSVTISNSVTSIGGSAFFGCSGLTSIEIPNSVTSIGGSAFFGCSGLTSIEIPNSVTSIGNDAFRNCSSLTSINVVNDNPNYSSKDGVFFDKQQTALIQYPGGKQGAFVIPNSVTSIGESAFYGCRSLNSITIGNNLAVINTGAFRGCENLRNIIIGSSVRVIEESAFYGCRAIETITCYSMRPPTVNNGAFETLPYSTIIYVPADYLNTYMMHDFWGIYDVRPIGASTTETTEVKVEPTGTTADVAWPVVENAATYELVIKDKSGNVVCTLIFNANGQLTQIAFDAPARDNAAHVAGFSFTVTGLEEGTSYDLTITAKDGNGTTLDEKTIAFTTSGETGVESINASVISDGSNKVFRNGEVLILRDGKTYTVQGLEVK